MDGAKLGAARKRKGWSQEKAAEMLQVNASAVQRWEQGKCIPRGYNLQQICDVFDLTPEDVLGAEMALSVELASPFSLSDATRQLQSLIQQDLTMRLWSLASQPSWSYQEVHGSMTRILKDYESMHSKNHHLTRRKALCRLATLPLATLGLAVFEREESPPAHLMKEILAQCTVSVAACWELRKSAEPDDLAVAFNGVCTYLPILQRMVKDSSQYRQEAAELTAQYLLLKSILGQHLEGILEAAQYAQQALLYSRETKNISLQLKALERLAVVYHYSKRHQQALQAIEQAVPLLDQTRSSMSSHVQALTNGMLAVILTRNGQDGMVYLDRAGRFVAEPDSQHLVYVNYEEADLLLQIGYVCYQQGDSTKALEALSQIVDPETLSLKVPWTGTGRIEAINTMTMASLKAKGKDMEQVLHFWTGGIQAARTLRSEQRFNEALHAYEIMEVVWPGEPRIKELRDLLDHW